MQGSCVPCGLALCASSAVELRAWTSTEVQLCASPVGGAAAVAIGVAGLTFLHR